MIRLSRLEKKAAAGIIARDDTTARETARKAAQRARKAAGMVYVAGWVPTHLAGTVRAWMEGK